MLSAKTERIDLLRRQYRNYLIRITGKTPEATKWKPIIKPQKDCKTPLLERELALPSSTQTQTNQEQMDILDRYLENMSSKSLLKGKSTDLLYNSNKASAIAEDIMNSIYSRHYNKVKESGDNTQEISSNTEKPQEADNRQSGGDCNLYKKQSESVYSLADNEIDERPSRDEAFVSALDVAVQQLSENNAKADLVEVSETTPNNQVEVNTIYYNQEYQPSETQIDDSESREEECGKSSVEVGKSSFQVESTEKFEEGESREQVVEQELEKPILPVESSEVVQSSETHFDEIVVENFENSEQENPILPVESTENSEVEQPSEPHVDESEIEVETAENFEQVKQENPVLSVESTENSEVVQPDDDSKIRVVDQNNAKEENVLEGTTNYEVEQPSNDLTSEPNNQPYYQSDLTYAEQYDQQQGYDQYGQPLVYNQQGEIVQPQFDENGQMLPQYDENGQLIMLYDHEGRAYFEDYGYGGQDGADDQSYLQNYSTVPEVGNEITEQKEQLDHQQENTENVQQEEVVEKQKEAEQLVKESVVAEEEIKNVEAKLGNVMDILDTDTEASSKHNTSKVSNDTDFDFS